MRLFNCKVRLANSLYNEVERTGVTAAEIYILRAIHGSMAENDVVGIDPASVVEIKPAGNIQRSDTEERARLALIYTVGLKKFGHSMASLFGVGNPLPNTVDGDSHTESPFSDEAAETDPGFEPAKYRLSGDIDVARECWEGAQAEKPKPILSGGDNDVAPAKRGPGRPKKPMEAAAAAG